jgi:hypothetical protein
MKIIFKTTVGLLSSIPGVRWTDKDKKQIDIYDTKPAVPFPCNLIKVAILSADTVTTEQQRCTGSIVVRTASDLSVSETSDKAPDTAVERSLSYYDIVDAVYDKLQGFTDDQIESIDMKSCVEEERRDGLTVVKTTFEVVFMKYTQAAD